MLDSHVLEPAGPNENRLRGLTIAELASQHVYQLESSVSISPGFTFDSVYKPRVQADLPPDDFHTDIRIPAGHLFVVQEIVGERIDSQEVAESRGRAGLEKLRSILRLKQSTVVEVEVGPDLYKVTSPVRSSSFLDRKPLDLPTVWCDPRFVEDLITAIGYGQSFVLERDLIIVPTYQGEFVMTEHHFAIKISAGSTVILKEGGTIGNVKVIIKSGRLIIQAFGDTVVDACRIVDDEVQDIDLPPQLES